MKTKICVLIMFTNEEHCIVDTIKSTLPYAYEYILLDNNSTDNTVALCEACLNNNQMKYQVFKTEWVNFGHNYSYLYELGHKYSDADYLWQIDSGDLLHGILNIEDLSHDCYLVCLRTDGLHYYRHQIFNNKLLWKQYLSVHGYTYTYPKTSFSQARLNGNYYIQTRRTTKNKVEIKNKYLNNVKLLQQDLLTDLDEYDRRRCYFYLAQSYYCANDYQKAIQIYKGRIEQDGWQEEVWYSRLQIARCYSHLNNHDKIIKYYKKCYQHHPCYAEAAYELGVYYMDNENYHEAKSMFEIAADKPFPTDKSLFLSKDVYDYRAKLWLAVVYYYVQQYNQSYDINMSLLKQSLPNEIRKKIEDNNRWNCDIIFDNTNLIKQLIKQYDPRINHYEIYRLADFYGNINVIELIKQNIIERNWYEKQMFNCHFESYGVNNDLYTYYRQYYIG